MAMKGVGIHQVQTDLFWGKINFYMFMCVLGVQVCWEDHEGHPGHLSTK